MCIVDAWLTWKLLHNVTRHQTTEFKDQQTFYSLLAEEMIDNNIDSRARRNRTSATEAQQRATYFSPTLVKTAHLKN
jgi:hypothetical protein